MRKTRSCSTFLSLENIRSFIQMNTKACPKCFTVRSLSPPSDFFLSQHNLDKQTVLKNYFSLLNCL